MRQCHFACTLPPGSNVLFNVAGRKGRPIPRLARGLRHWLSLFAFRTNIAWSLFALTGAGTLAVALLTVSFQALRAARTDPVSALKYE